ncbi:hypothetical protein ES703_114325 [subsurface metagenome]
MAVARQCPVVELAAGQDILHPISYPGSGTPEPEVAPCGLALEREACSWSNLAHPLSPDRGIGSLPFELGRLETWQPWLKSVPSRYYPEIQL